MDQGLGQPCAVVESMEFGADRIVEVSLSRWHQIGSVVQHPLRRGDLLARPAIRQVVPGTSLTAHRACPLGHGMEAPEQCAEVAEPAEVADRCPPLVPRDRCDVLGDQNGPPVDDRSRHRCRASLGGEIGFSQEP
jgi:hypothetical protein